jgi:hypothetical protein
LQIEKGAKIQKKILENRKLTSDGFKKFPKKITIISRMLQQLKPCGHRSLSDDVSNDFSILMLTSERLCHPTTTFKAFYELIGGSDSKLKCKSEF